MRLQNSIATVFLVYFLLIRVVILQNTVYTLWTKCLPKIGEKFLNGALDDLNTVPQLERPRPFFPGCRAPQSRKFQNVKIAIYRNRDDGWLLDLTSTLKTCNSTHPKCNFDSRSRPIPTGCAFRANRLFQKGFFRKGHSMLVTGPNSALGTYLGPITFFLMIARIVIELCNLT